MASSLGSFEALVLLSVLRLGSDAYGVGIQREIAARTGREPTFGALYTTLDRLAGKGFVCARMSAPTAVRGGRRKKIYRLEAAGEVALSEAWDAWKSMTEGLGARLDALRLDALRVESMEGVGDG